MISSSLRAAGDPDSCTVYLKSVQLKKSSGEWITVIDPDKAVDLTKEEAGISFFNNQGRVPEGSYVNFGIILSERVRFSGRDGAHSTQGVVTARLDLNRDPSSDEATLTAREDFSPPIAVKKGDFLSVWFHWDLGGTVHFAAPNRLGPGIPKEEAVLFLPPQKIEKASLTIGQVSKDFSGDEMVLAF